MTGGRKPRVAWISAETPDRYGGGGQRRQYHQVRALLRAGIDVRVAALAGPQDDASMRELVPAVRFGPPRGRARRPDPALAGFLADGAFDAGVVAHVESVPHARRALARARIPWLLDLQNVNSRFQRSRGDLRQAAAWWAREAAAVLAANRATVCSPEERAALGRRLARGRVEVAGNGIDPAEWPAEAMAPRRRSALGLVGSWEHGPNRDGARWLVAGVWPAVRRAVPEARLLLVGPGRPPEEALAAQGVEHLGRVPDLARFLGGIRVAVVPIVGGIGSRVKFGESLASGAAVVSTPEGAEGFDAEGAFVSAPDAEDFARACIDLLSDESRAAALGRAGRALAMERLTWEVTSRPLCQFVREAAA